jgi:hypothetical protein
MQHSDRNKKRRLKLPFIILPLLRGDNDSLSIIAAALSTRNISFTLRNHDAIIGNSIFRKYPALRAVGRQNPPFEPEATVILL